MHLLLEVLKQDPAGFIFALAQHFFHHSDTCTFRGTNQPLLGINILLLFNQNNLMNYGWEDSTTTRIWCWNKDYIK